MYAITRAPGQISENQVQTLKDRDTWAIYKLWTNWHAAGRPSPGSPGRIPLSARQLRLLSEAGAVSDNGTAQSHRRGEVEEILLKISAVDKQSTGYQLAVTLPDKATEASLKDFYGSVLNGGAVNDQKGFDFGNETDGWYYAGSCWMYGMALAAGVPAPGRLSSHPYDAAQAFREHLAHVLSVLDEQGRGHFGYNQGGQWVDDNLHTIIGMLRLPAAQRRPGLRSPEPARDGADVGILSSSDAMLEGLFKLADAGAHWYYDAVSTSGMNGYYNAFFYKAASDLAAMEAAADREEQAERVSDDSTADQERRSTRCCGKRTPPAGRVTSIGLTPRARKYRTSAICASGRRSRWASPRRSRPARSWPRPTPGSPGSKRNTATGASPGCRPSGPCPMK